jgi:hypothetical protein
MIRHGGTEGGARRRGLHITGVFGHARADQKKGGIVQDAYVRDGKGERKRGKVGRACYDAIKCGEGKSLQDIIDNGLEKGSWE